MKGVYIIFAVLLLSASVWSQSPEMMSYQALIRNSNDELVTNTLLGLRVSILQGSANGEAVYVETHSPTSNANGLVTIEIGTGEATFDFSSIDWAAGPYFIKTETDPEGGTNYTITGTSQLLSVPYALYAKESSHALGADEIDPVFNNSVAAQITGNDIIEWNNRDVYEAGTGISISNFVISNTDSTVNIDIKTSTEIEALTPSEGYTVYNTTENLLLLYYNGSWVSLPTSCWPQPTTANAGTDQSVTDSSTSVTLAGNAPENGHGTGEWSVVGDNSGIFDNSLDPNTAFAGDGCSTYHLEWKISTNCGTSADTVTIVFYHTPTISDAGNDQMFLDGTVSTTLQGNQPEEGHGTGIWNILSGSGGSLADESDPRTVFSGQLSETYVLEWTISTNCSVSSDEVSVTFSATTQANAGEDRYFTDGSTVTPLNGNAPEGAGETGEWSVLSGTGGVFMNPASPNTLFFGQLHQTYLLRWTITNNGAFSEDSVIIAFWKDEPGPPLSDVEGNEYNSVYIGGQHWMSENLNTTLFNDGSSIPLETDNDAWNSLTTPAYCYYNNDEATYGDQYGALYNWYAVNTSNLCPSGWHIPTEDEWNILVDYMGLNGYSGMEGLALKSATDWNNDGNGTDNFGFKGLPGGNHDYMFWGQGDYGLWWSAGAATGVSGIGMVLSYHNNEISIGSYAKKMGFSIRCLKD